MLINSRELKIYIVIALVSLFATLWVPYVGEEAIYTISAFEMWYHHGYLVNTIYGDLYGRPPLLNWLLIPLARWLGWSNVLLASRLLSAMSTSIVAAGLWWFSKRMTKNQQFALLCTAIFLTGDLLFMRGWLAYADPLLTLFVFLSSAFLWLGVEEKKSIFFLLAIVSLGAGFLVKALSPYYFYGITGLVLLIFHHNRKFLLSFQSILIHLCALSIPFLWDYISGVHYFTTMWTEMVSTAFSPTLGKYIYQILVVQPGMLLLNLAPISLLAVFYYFYEVKNKQDTEFFNFNRIAFWIALANFAICWFAPRWPEPRYYMPVLPMMAIVMAYVLWNTKSEAYRLLRYGLVLTLICKLGFVSYDYIRYDIVEPDRQSEAEDILRIIHNATLRVDVQTKESAPVEKLAIYLNLMRYPKSPLLSTNHVEQKIHFTYNPSLVHQCDGVYVLGQIQGSKDRLIKRYSTKKRQVSLFCRRNS